MEAASPHEVSSLSTYLRILRRRKWIVLACVILTPLTAYVVTARQPAQYQASAQVYLSSQDLAGALTGISVPYVDARRFLTRVRQANGQPRSCLTCWLSGFSVRARSRA